MADRVPLTMTEGNDETVELTIGRRDADDDLTTIVVLNFYLKDDACDPDAAGLTLSSTDPTKLVILTQSAAQITALAYVPASALVGSWPRFYHVRGFNASGQGRDALYGPVTVNAV